MSHSGFNPEDIEAAVLLMYFRYFDLDIPSDMSAVLAIYAIGRRRRGEMQVQATIQAQQEGSGMRVASVAPPRLASADHYNGVRNNTTLLQHTGQIDSRIDRVKNELVNDDSLFDSDGTIDDPLYQTSNKVSRTAPICMELASIQSVATMQLIALHRT